MCLRDKVIYQGVSSISRVQLDAKVCSSYGPLAYFPIFSFLSKMLSILCRKDYIFARDENIRKICKRTIT